MESKRHGIYYNYSKQMLKFIKTGLLKRKEQVVELKATVDGVVENFSKISNIQSLRQADELRQLCWLLRRELFAAPGEVTLEQVHKKNRLIKQIKSSKEDELVHYVLERIPKEH